MPLPELRKRRSDFVARTIAGVTGAIERTVYTEELARADGLLQLADPRAKVILFVIAAAVIGVSRTLPVLLSLYALLVALALWSRLSLGFFVKRVLLGVPLFAAIVYVPALFLVDGRSLVHLALGPVTISVTGDALLGGAVFLARVTVSVSLAVLLVVTTRWADLLKALRVLRAPSVFVVVLGMTYRYVFLLLQSVDALFLARTSRTVGETSDREQRRWVGNSMGALMSKSFTMSSAVYQAMVARGFTGEVRTLTDFQMRDEDWLLVSAGVVILAVATMADSGLR